MKKTSILLFLLLLIMIIFTVLIYNYLSTPVSLGPDINPSVHASHEKTIDIVIDERGFSHEKIIWKITVLDFLSYFPEGEWGLLIPIDAENIAVKEKRDEIGFKTEKYSDKYSLLKFSNSLPIKKNSDFFFEISYSLEKNPIVYEPFYFYERAITRFDKDEVFTLLISLPESASVLHSSKTPLSNSNNKLSFNIEKGESVILEIDYKMPNASPQLATIASAHYKATLPSRYSDYYISLLEEADKGYELLEEIYGFSPQYEKINIEMIHPGSQDFEEDVGAFHLGEGRIRMRITNLLKPEMENLNIILHETVHVFNSKYFGNTGTNHWFEEGTASYFSEDILEKLGHDVSALRNSNSEIIAKCRNSDKSYISDWRPNIYLNSKEQVECSGVQYSPVQAGYAQSYNIISRMVELYGDDTLERFYKIAEDKKIEFSSDHAELNAQIAQILSEAVQEDTSNFLSSMGVEVKGKSETITGMPILKIEEPYAKTKLKILLVITFIILLILILKAARKPVRNSHGEEN